MNKNNDSKGKSDVLLVLAVIVASIVIIWLIRVFDGTNNSSDKQGNENTLIKQTLSDNLYYNFYDLLILEKNYT